MTQKDIFGNETKFFEKASFFNGADISGGLTVDGTVLGGAGISTTFITAGNINVIQDYAQTPARTGVITSYESHSTVVQTQIIGHPDGPSGTISIAPNIQVTGDVTADKFVGVTSTAAGEKHNQFSVNVGINSAVITSITWHTTYNGTTQLLGNILNGTDPNIKALYLTQWYQHNGSTNHGYLSGWIFQTGKDSNSGVYMNNAHYDWYYNVIEVPIIIPWDPYGTQQISMYVTSAYNSSANNTYAFYHKGYLKQT